MRYMNDAHGEARTAAFATRPEIAFSKTGRQMNQRSLARRNTPSDDSLIRDRIGAEIADWRAAHGEESQERA